MCAAHHFAGVTTILWLEVMKVVVAAFVPTCGELLWSDLFNFVNEWFCFVALFETIFVLYLYNHNEHTLFIPDWMTKLLGWEKKAQVAGDASNNNSYALRGVPIIPSRGMLTHPLALGDTWHAHPPSRPR